MSRYYSKSFKGIRSTAIISVCTLVFAFSLCIIWVLFAPGRVTCNVIVMIPGGTSISGIASILKSQRLIKDEYITYVAAKAYCLATNRRVNAGEYFIKANSSLYDVLTTLFSGRIVDRYVTIPEGLTLSQIEKIICRSYGIICSKQAVRYKEGWLLPETYQYNYGAESATILKRMNLAMLAHIDKIWRERVPHPNIKTQEDLIKLASIVQKEAADPEDMARIANLYINRLNKGMLLQADPTILYAYTLMGQNKKQVRYNDLRVVSKYNTYMYPGLPPSAISNPGYSAIKAVANWEPTSDLYCVSDGNGKHVFAANYSKHLANVSIYRQKIQKKQP